MLASGNVINDTQRHIYSLIPRLQFTQCMCRPWTAYRAASSVAWKTSALRRALSL